MSNETISEIQKLNISGRDVRMIISQMLLDMRKGTISKEELQSASSACDSLSRSMQTELNHVKLQMQADREGKHFGKLLINASNHMGNVYGENVDGDDLITNQ